MTWGDFCAALLAGGAAATAAFATYRANQELRAMQEAQSRRSRQPSGAEEMDPLDPRLWRHGVPPDFLRTHDDHEAIIRSRTHQHSGSGLDMDEHGFDEHHDRFSGHGHLHADGWGFEPDAAEWDFSHYLQHQQGSDRHRSGHDLPPAHLNRDQPFDPGMDTFQELFDIMHEHMMGSRVSPRRAGTAEVLSDMRSRGHPEGWDPQLWGDLDRVHHVMMGRLGNLHAAAAAAGASSGDMLDPLALQLSLVDRDFTEADYEMLMRLDDPARGRPNRAPLTESQLAELPTHTFQPHARGDQKSSPHMPPSGASSCSSPPGASEGRGNAANKASIWSKTKATLSSKSSNGKAAGSNSETKESQPEAEAACHSCSICLDDFQPGEGVMTLPCLHQFHATCVGQWLKQEGQAGACPVCKHPVWQQRS